VRNVRTSKKQRNREMKRKQRIADKQKKAKKRLTIQEMARDDLSVNDDFNVGLGSHSIPVYTGNTSVEEKRLNEEQKYIRQLQIQKYWEYDGRAGLIQLQRQLEENTRRLDRVEASIQVRQTRMNFKS